MPFNWLSGDKKIAWTVLLRSMWAETCVHVAVQVPVENDGRLHGPVSTTVEVLGCGGQGQPDE